MRERMSKVEWVAFVLGIAAFWVLRIAYWTNTSEAMFSDMADFDATARGILSDFCFNFNPFFRSYFAPTVPTLRAIQIFLFGDSLIAWQFFQTMFLFVGVVWLAFELNKLTKVPLLGVVLVWLVALSKPSIFWSYKLAREAVAESFTVLAIAALLYAFRTPRKAAHLVAGIIFGIGILIRGTFIATIPVVLVMLYFYARSARSTNARFLLPATFILGIALIWGPWVARSVRLYGGPVWVSSGAPYVFFWDLGSVSVRLEDGSTVSFTSQSLQADAPVKFENDYLAAQYANKLVGLYVWQNLETLPSLVWRRLSATVTDRAVHLTKVSREDLFNGIYLNSILLDKTPELIVLGSLGLLLVPFVFGAQLFLLPLLVVWPWINNGMVLGYARMLESSISLILFGNILCVALLVKVANLAWKKFQSSSTPAVTSAE